LKISPIQYRDTCLAITFLLLLLLGLYKNMMFYYASIVFLLVGMIFPSAMKPFAIVWFGLAELLGSVVSKVILLVVFATIVLPVAITRQVLGKDPLRLQLWKSSNESCFVERNYTYSAKDFDKTY